MENEEKGDKGEKSGRMIRKDTMEKNEKKI